MATGPECGGERGPARPPPPSPRTGWRGVRLPTPPTPLRPSQHARPGSAARRRCHPLFGSSFPLLPAPLARPEPHTSVLEPNQTVSLSFAGAKACPFGAWNLTCRKLLALFIPLPRRLHSLLMILLLIHCSSCELSFPPRTYNSFFFHLSVSL